MRPLQQRLPALNTKGIEPGIGDVAHTRTLEPDFREFGAAIVAILPLENTQREHLWWREERLKTPLRSHAQGAR